MDGHVLERIGYLAIHSSNGSGKVDLGKDTIPYLLQTTMVDEKWYPVLGNSIKLEEETSASTEIFHADEAVNSLALGQHLFAQVVSNNGSETIALRVKRTEHLALLEWGTVQGVTHDWVTIPLAKTYINPVVVAKVAEQVGSDPGVVRLRNVTGDSFQARFEEWDYLNDQHTAERLFYLVAEEGGGSRNVGGLNYEAGTLNTDALVAESWEAVTFSRAFKNTPALFTSVMTYQGSDAVTSRVHKLNAYGFDVAMQEMESLTDGHTAETLGWIAIEQGTGTTADGRNIETLSIEASDIPTSFGFSQTFDRRFPVMLQSLSSTWGENTAVAAQEYLTVDAVDVYVREETSADLEVAHTTEDISVFVAE
jgi:hypothetical protein